MIECPKCGGAIHPDTAEAKTVRDVRAELERQKELNARLHQGVCDGYATLHERARRMEDALRFALSTESGFACPTATEERLRSALGDTQGNAP